MSKRSAFSDCECCVPLPCGRGSFPAALLAPSLFFKVTATDADAGDTLTFTVTVTGGTLSAAQAGFIQTFTGGVYNDPSPGVSPHLIVLSGTAVVSGTIELTIVVDDGKGGTDTFTLNRYTRGCPSIKSHGAGSV